MQVSNTFPKNEHLCGEIRIGKLFTEGEAFIVYPLRVVYKIHKSENISSVKVLINAPKKRFKRAVQRNKIKRLIREAYRLNKKELLSNATEKNVQIEIAFNYVADVMLDLIVIETKIQIALKRIKTKLDNF